MEATGIYASNPTALQRSCARGHYDSGRKCDGTWFLQLVCAACHYIIICQRNKRLCRSQTETKWPGSELDQCDLLWNVRISGTTSFHVSVRTAHTGYVLVKRLYVWEYFCRPGHVFLSFNNNNNNYKKIKITPKSCIFFIQWIRFVIQFVISFHTIRLTVWHGVWVKKCWSACWVELPAARESSPAGRLVGPGGEQPAASRPLCGRRGEASMS